MKRSTLIGIAAVIGVVLLLILLSSCVKCGAHNSGGVSAGFGIFGLLVRLVVLAIFAAGCYFAFIHRFEIIDFIKNLFKK